MESEFLSPALGNDFLKGFDPESPDLRERGLSEFLVEDLGFLGLPELLLSLLILNIFAKIVI
ncbi:hypothetical protein CHRYSEO8AT_250021 [Chryseobacterium sp. 8AT]|nr:hypothetical protein CHRYSEO8AT_250021 [Chryseobacterium sp. 8AT]